MMPPFDGKVVLITGGSRGIGRETALEFARRGADVAIAYFRNDEAARATVADVEALGRRAHAIRGRLDSRDRVQAIADEAIDVFGGIDVVVSNAASGVIRPALETTERHWDWTLHTNSRAILLLAQASVPSMLERGGGAIIGVSSLGSFRVLENYSLVGISKAALEAAIRYLGVELAPRGIRVNGVSGAVVHTDALDSFPNRDAMLAEGRSRTPVGRMLEPPDLARVIVFLASEDASMIIGQTLIVDGGFSLPC